MRKTAILWLAALLLARPCGAAELTEIETEWLHSIWPVVVFAKQTGLPLDVVVQPQPTPGEPPLALGFVDGRCKLALSMRGNNEAVSTLARIPPALRDAALELMAAHELGHCQRHLEGAWLETPSGFAPRAPDGLSPKGKTAYLGMQAQRREEAYADLVGLAWVQQRHAALYPSVQEWLMAERSHDLIESSPHDTLAWVRAAADPAALRGATIFDAAARLWSARLQD